jgi:molybdate transport system regulatory protein
MYLKVITVSSGGKQVDREIEVAQPMLRLVAEPGDRGGKGRIELLKKIAELGSISAAAKTLGLSYKTAWEAVEAMNNLSEAPLVARVAGGKCGGGTTLTALGLEVLVAFRRLDHEYRRFLTALRGREDFGRFYRLMRSLEMRSSARNEFLGRVKVLKKGAVNAEVVLDIGGGAELVAVITNESVDTLNLAIGSEAIALVKAPWVIITTDTGLKTSARNRLCGTVARCTEGAVNSEVVIDLPGSKSVTSIVTKDSVRSLGLKVGVPACALIKASHIILAVNA